MADVVRMYPRKYLDFVFLSIAASLCNVVLVFKGHWIVLYQRVRERFAGGDGSEKRLAEIVARAVFA